MAEKSKPISTDYNTERKEIEEFLTTFKGSGEDAKYQAVLDSIRTRQTQALIVSLDDVQEFNRELYNHIVDNTERYVRLFYAVADDLIGEVNYDFSSQFGALAATRNAAWAESRDGDDNSKPPFPPELHRPYSLRFTPGSKEPIAPMREVRAESIGHLVRIRGLVTRVTQVKPLIRVAAYTCSQCSEETFQPINSPTFTPLTSCQSAQCKSSPRPGFLTLQTRSSRFEKFQMVRIQELSSEVPAGHIPRAMTIYARESLTQKCQTGDVVEIDGIFLPLPLSGFRQSLVNETYIEAENITVSPKSGSLATDDDEPLSSEGDIYGRLASSIAPEIFGLDDVKKSLLLELVGGVTRKFDDGVRIRGDINICLMGDPGVAKSQLLKWVSRVSPRAVYTTGRGSSGVGLTAAVLKDPISGEMALEGGALVLSDMGICCIDEFDKMDESDRTAIYEVMEQQTVSIAKAGITTTLNARTSILAAANPAHSHYNVKRSLLENVNLPSALLSRFDLLFLLLDRPTVDSDVALANHIAYVHQNRKAPESTAMSISQLRRFIDKAKTFDPIIREDLSRYISAAYVQMRQETVDSPVTPRSLLAILRLSMALARLRFSNEVTESEVDEALRLVKASKESIETVDTESAHHLDITSQIFDKVSDTWRGESSASMQEVRRVILQSGFTQEQLDQAINEYERLAIWQTNPEYSKLLFIANSKE